MLATTNKNPNPITQKVTLSDREITFTVTEHNKKVIVRMDHTKIGEFASIKDVSEFAKKLVALVSPYEGDGRPLIFMKGAEIVGIAEDQANLIAVPSSLH